MSTTKISAHWANYISDLFLVILAILLALPLLAHAYVGFFTRYMADDYCVAATVSTEGLLSTQKIFYLGYFGRFSFTFLEGFLTMFGPRIVPFLTVGALVLMLCGLTWTILQFVSEHSLRRPLLTSFLLAELIVVVTITDNRGGVYEALYWQTGMLTYWPPLILMVAYAGLVKRLNDQKKRISTGAAYLVLGGALSFVAGGFNETYALIQICALSVALAWCLSLRVSKLLPILSAGLVGAVMAMVIVALAPGNSVRQARFPPHPSWLQAVKSSVTSALNFMFFEQNYPGTFYIRSLALLVPCLIAIYLIRDGDTTKRPAPSRKQITALVLIPPLAFALMVACFAPALWIMSRQPPFRTLVVPEFVLVCVMVVWSYLAGQLLRVAFLRNRHRSFPLLRGLSLLLVVFLSLLPLAAARTTFSKVRRARSLALIWDKQDQEIRAARERGETNLTVPIAYNIGATDLMTADPEWYVNRCMAHYYGVDTITARPSPEGLRIMADLPGEQ